MLQACAQVIFRNTGTSKIFIAYCAGNLITGWTTKGWFPVEPGEEKSVYNISVLAFPKFYYCATIENCDQGFFGSTPFPVDPANAFTIAHADKAQNFTNPAIKSLNFREIDLGTQKTYTIELKPMNLTCNHQRQGKWRVSLDKDGEYAEKQEDAYYYREITFKDGQPIGWCKDYYADGMVRAEFKLLQAKPVIFDGKCTWYNRDGSVEKEVIYQNGTPATDHAVYEPVVLPIQNFFVNSTSNEAFSNGHSKVPYYFSLPPNTVKWYYEFTATRNKDDIQSLTNGFSAAAKLSSVVDKTGLLSFSINLLTAPPGADYCNVYVMDQRSAGNFSSNLKGTTYFPTCSRLNYRSGIVEVMEPSLKQPAIVFANPSGLYGISVSIQVVAIVAKSY